MSNFYQQPPPQQQHPGMYGGPGGVPQQGAPMGGAGFPGFQNVSPEMINFGLHAGQDILNKQKDKWMPGVSGFWVSLKYYFSVSVKTSNPSELDLSNFFTLYLIG